MMRALCLKKAGLELCSIDEPKIESPDHVKMKVLEVGICGTDRELLHAKSLLFPKGQEHLILGHEMLGRVVEVGELVTHVKPGDLAIFTVRRSCRECPACDTESFDMCYTEHYLERGIKEKDGFQAEYVVDHEKHLIKVPMSLRSCAVLSEPTSVIEKGIDVLIQTQKARLNNWKEENCLLGRRVLIAGIGAIGLLAAMVFLLHGAEVWGYDITPPDSLRPSLLKKMGGNYIYGKEVSSHDISKHTHHIDVIFEAVGNVELSFHLTSNLGANGAYILTGVTDPNKSLNCNGGKIIRNLVLKNQAFIGSVNAHKRHWEQAIIDLERAKAKWGSIPDAFITNKFSPEEFMGPFYSRQDNEIKTVIQWDSL